MDDRNAERDIFASVNESTQFDEGKLFVWFAVLIIIVMRTNDNTYECYFLLKGWDVNNKCCRDLHLIFMAQLLVLVLKNLNRNLN